MKTFIVILMVVSVLALGVWLIQPEPDKRSEPGITPESPSGLSQQETEALRLIEQALMN